MYIIEVIPLANLPPQIPQLLSYFFTKFLPRGAVVEVLINNRRVSAIVVSSAPIEEQRISIKKSGFQLKKISTVINDTPQVNGTQFKLALWLSQNYYAPLGLCLKTVLPSFFGKKNYTLHVADHRLNTAENIKPIIILSPAKRVKDVIRPEIKKAIAQKKQVLIILPEVSLIDYFHKNLADDYKTAIMHAKITPKQLYKNWQSIGSGETQVIIGTRQALFSPFNNLGLVIVEDFSNESYKSDMTPKYNTAYLAEYIAGINNSQIIYFARVVDINKYFYAKSGLYEIRNKYLEKRPNIKILDMVQEIKRGNFSAISDDLKNLIKDYSEKKKRILIFSSRKGYSALLVCRNCGSVGTCPKCNLPMKFYKAPEPMLVCHRCSESKKAPTFCPNCNSSEIKATGIPGSEKLEEEVGRIFNDYTRKPEILILDASTIKNPKAEKDLISKLDSATESIIVIATQMIFSHRYDQHFNLIGIPQADALMNMPDFGSEESLLYQFEKIIDFHPEKIIIQTYNPNNNALNTAVSGDYGKFYDKELEARKILWYPPFIRLIKISFDHINKEKASYEARILAEKLKMVIGQKKLDTRIKMLGPSPAYIEKRGGLYKYNIILKIIAEQRPEEILSFVPSHWNIDIDPKSIL